MSSALISFWDPARPVETFLALARSLDIATLDARDALRAAEALPLWSRSRLYLRMLGPGYLQSAMTLGGGSCTAAIFAGAVFGYQLLWVAPVAMGLGLFVLSAAAHQTLSSGIRPYEAMRRFAGPGVAFAWAGGALLASVIWHFPHYALGAALVADLSDALGGIPLPPAIAGAVVAALVVPFSLYYTLEKPDDLDEIRQLEDLGVTHCNATPWGAYGQEAQTLAQRLDGLKRFGDEVIAKRG